MLAEAQVKAQHLTLETEADKQRAENTQRLLAESQGKLAQIKDVRVTNPFVLVLIDGDGYIFPEDLLRQGIQGGETAAHRLHELIEKWFQRDPRCKDTDAGHWRIKVRIYLNLDGLSRTLYNAKIVPDLQTLRQFMIGFTRNQQLFDVVDVGYGKERTDYKIKANFDNDIHNSSCKYVILGCAHDNGYIPMLESYKNNDRVRKRISVLSNEAATQQFKALIGATRTQSGGLEFKPFGELGLPVLQSSASLNNPTRSPISPKLAIGLPLKPQPTPPHSPTEPPPPVKKSHYYPQPIYVNQANQRVDQPTPDPSLEATQRIHEASPKLCNNYHLVGYCRNNPCRFSHTPLSSVDEIWALVRYARNKPCNGPRALSDRKVRFRTPLPARRGWQMLSWGKLLSGTFSRA